MLGLVLQLQSPVSIIYDACRRLRPIKGERRDKQRSRWNQCYGDSPLGSNSNAGARDARGSWLLLDVRTCSDLDVGLERELGSRPGTQAPQIFASGGQLSIHCLSCAWGKCAPYAPKKEDPLQALLQPWLAEEGNAWRHARHINNHLYHQSTSSSINIIDLQILSCLKGCFYMPLNPC